MPLRPKLYYWTALGAAMAAACSPEAPAPQADAGDAASSGYTTDAEAGGEGAGGEEGAEGGGGEFGIDPAVAREDRAAFLSAVEVMRAHYIAGLAALENGDRAAASALFSHPISEIYLDLQPVIEELGGPALYDTLNNAAVAHFQGADEAAIRALVDDVLAGLDAVEAVAPGPGPAGPAAADARVLAGLIERAALMYPVAQAQPDGDAWLDGYGYAAAAVRYRDAAIAEVRALDPDIAATLDQGTESVAAAFAAAERPDVLDADADALAAAAEAAREAVREF